MGPTGPAGNQTYTINQFRLTLTSHLPVTINDVSGAGTLYLSPLGEDATQAATTGTAQISLPNGSSGGWSILSSAQVSLSLTVATGKNYDVFAYNSSGTLTLALGSAWTNDTTRADALGCLDGIPTNSVTVAGQTANKCLYLGTIRATGTNAIEDSNSNRFLWNYYNRVGRRLYVDTTGYGAGFTPSGAVSWHQVNGSTANQVNFVIGVAEDALWAQIAHYCNSTNTQVNYAGIGLDTTTSPDCQAQFSFGPASISYVAQVTKIYLPGIGKHYIAALEMSTGGGATYFTQSGETYVTGIVYG